MTSRLTALVLAAVDGQEHALRAQPPGGPQRHRRVDAEHPRLVRRRRDDATLVRAAAADDDRPAAQLRPIPLLDGREERVEVDVEDDALAHAQDSRPVNGPPGTNMCQPVARPAVEPSAKRRISALRRRSSEALLAHRRAKRRRGLGHPRVPARQPLGSTTIVTSGVMPARTLIATL